MRYIPALQDVHVVEVVLQVTQLLLHARQDVPDRYVPFGQVETQLVPFKYGVAEAESHVRHTLKLLQVAHVLAHARHVVPLE